MTCTIYILTSEEDDFSALTHVVDAIVNKFIFEGIDKDGDLKLQ